MRILLSLLGVLLFTGTAFAQGKIAIWAEDFRDKAGLAVMIHLKTSDASICFKDVKIKTNLGEDSMISFGCTADNREGTFMVYPAEDADISKVSIFALSGVSKDGGTIELTKMLALQNSSEEGAVKISLAASTSTAPQELGKFSVSGVYLSSTYEFNDSVAKFLNVSSEQDLKNQRQIKQLSCSELFSPVRILNSNEVKLLKLNQQQMESFLYGFQNITATSIGAAYGTRIMVEKTNNKIIYIRYVFEGNNIKVEEVLPSIEKKFGPSKLYKEAGLQYYIWSDGLSFAIMTCVLRGHPGSEQSFATGMELIDLEMMRNLVNAFFKTVNQKGNADAKKVGSAFE